jgi:glycerate 2-kinase
VSPGGARRARLEALFREAVAAVDAGAAVRRAVERRDGELAVAGVRLAPGARLVVLAVGKAAAGMAAALEERAGPWIAAGLAVTKDGHGVALQRIALREAAHPVPDLRSVRAAREAIELVQSAGPEDVLVVLLSGGASSLLSGPAPGLTPDDVARATDALLAGGVAIEGLNAVRKHLSEVAGGRLAQRARCRRVEVLAISDVPGDRPDVIGSGPFAADPTTYAEALRILDRSGAAGRGATRARAHLEAGARGEREETPKPGDPAFARVRTTVLANNRTALEAARDAAARAGGRPFLLDGALRGEARDAGRRLAALAASLACARRVCLIAGGETTVQVRGRGRGGRSQEVALAAALELAGRAEIGILAAGTDGTDGPTDAAGAYADGGTVARGRARGVDARASLADNDAYRFFSAEGGLFRTGPTGTNVRDLALLEVAPSLPAGRGADADRAGDG